MTPQKIKILQHLHDTFLGLRAGNEPRLRLIDEAELPEAVYNSNAIDNSTLTLGDTERVLLDLEVPKDFSLREVSEVKNLARVSKYIQDKELDLNFDLDTILYLHGLLWGGINDATAGRFRKSYEYRRISDHSAPAPEEINRRIEVLINDYTTHHNVHIIDRIAYFHLQFESILPFFNANGRIGRLLINIQLQAYGYPHVIIRNKEKKWYFQTFKSYRKSNNIDGMSDIIYLALLESLHKRICYLKGNRIITLAEYAKKHKILPTSLLNKASRQTVPAFRENSVWKIAESYKLDK